jgi:hypothetical protein
MAASLTSRTADEWRDRLGRFEASKWTVADYCVIEGVSVSSFYQWRNKLERSVTEVTASPTRRTDFTPVRLVGSATAIVQLPGGTRLEIPMSDGDAFERALDVLVRADARRAEAASC